MIDDPNVREKRIDRAEYYSQACLLHDVYMKAMVWDESSKMWRHHLTLTRDLDQARRMHDIKELTE